MGDEEKNWKKSIHALESLLVCLKEKLKVNKPCDEVLGAAQFTEHTMRQCQKLSKVVKSCQELSKVVKSCQKLSKVVKSCHKLS